MFMLLMCACSDQTGMHKACGGGGVHYLEQFCSWFWGSDKNH
jgi:hypothetical protein